MNLKADESVKISPHCTARVKHIHARIGADSLYWRE